MSGGLVYYNENDPKAASWLRWLIDAGLIPAGRIDRRSIVDVQPGDLDGYVQHHFFAGIGGWALALRLADWPAARPLWTASYPCQPFSSAGRRLGSDDPRHLWPHVFRLVRARRPVAVLGEQVAGQDGLGWFDGVQSDLDAECYASRAVDIPAAAVDSPQVRQRLYWLTVALARTSVDGRGEARGAPVAGREFRPRSADEDVPGPLARAADDGRQEVGAGDGPIRRQRSEVRGWTVESSRPRADDGGPARGVRPGNDRDMAGAAGGRRALGAEKRAAGPDDAFASDAPDGRLLGRSGGAGLQEPQHPSVKRARWGLEGRAAAEPDGVHGSFWADADWIICHDGKARRVADACAPLLAHGFPGRVAGWRGVGNAIVPPLAAQAVAALADVWDELT